ncbi:MAG: Hsp70 family protein, partial [Gammaproteobacteria bacterium]|nr:Hsp70 family protein [Gammaproteobacteria bacterium]
PQIEVTFDTDANGILNVGAKDKATGKQQSIVIKASSGLSDKEIEQMVKDAESHAEEDKKFHDLVATRNQADNLIHATRKSMEDLGSKVSEEEKQKIDAAIKDLEAAMKTDDKDAIEEKTKVLVEASGKIAEKAYAQAQSQAGANEQGAAGGSGDSQGGSGGGEEVVDAEFEEVKDDK